MVDSVDPGALVVAAKALEVAGSIDAARSLMRGAGAALDALAAAGACTSGSRGDAVRHDVLAAELRLTPREAAALMRRVPGARRVGRRWFVARAALDAFLASAPTLASGGRERVSAVDRDLAELGFERHRRAGGAR